MEQKETLGKKIDWVMTLVPFVGVSALCALFMLVPDDSKTILEAIRKFIGDDCGIYYAILGVGVFLVVIMDCILQVRKSEIRQSG